MAQYYNLVTGTSVPIMVEDVQQICEGQSIQLVVEDLNNCTNGGQQFLTYTAASQHHDSGLFPQRTILGGHLTGVPIDQRQNVYIINTTNDLPVQQSGLKADVVHASLANDGIVNIVDERGNQYVIAGTKLPLNNIHEVQQQQHPQQHHQQLQQQQQIQWISMPENNISSPAVKVASTVRAQQQRTGASDQCSSPAVSQYCGPGSSDKKSTPRLYRNKGRGGVTGGGPTRQSLVGVESSPMTKGTTTTATQQKNSPKPQLSLGTGVQSSLEDTTRVERIAPQNSYLTNNRANSVGNSSGVCRGKNFGTPSSNAAMHNSRPPTTVKSAVAPSKNSDNIGQARNATNSPAQAMKNLSAQYYPAMDSLSERIKQAKLQKVLPTTGQALALPVNVPPASPTARPPLHSGPTKSPLSTPTTTTASSANLNQRGNSQATGTNDNTSSANSPQQTLAPGTKQQQRRSMPKTPRQDSRHALETGKKQCSTPSRQKYQRETTQTTTAAPSSTTMSDNDEKMEIDSITSEYTVESDSTNNHEQHESSNDDNDSSTASFAYLQKVIENPQNTIVQNQISGNTAKMLVVLQNGEQRLITFDIPNEPCTVQDLLEQANISFGEETSVSLVSDRILGINYIVEGGAHMAASCEEDGEYGDASQNQDNVTAATTNTNNTTTPDSSSPNFALPDENSNSSVTPHEEPKFVDGKLAVCPNCGISSPDFHRCSRCKRILPDNVKSIPMTPDTQAKKETMISIDSFYKKANEQNASAKLEAAKAKKQAAARGGRRPAAKTRPVKEPECLTISSDEEEGGDKPRKSDSNMSNVSSSTGCGMNVNDELDTILEKEPVITNSSTSPSSEWMVDSEGGIKGGGKDDDSSEENSSQKPQTSLVCRTVRIGSYKYIPRDPIIISQSGLRLAVPLLEDDNSYVNLEVKFKEIVKVLIHFGKTMPVLFFYTSTNSAAMIREVLGMQDPKGPYYDPAGRDHTHKRITLLPESLTPESKVILKGLFAPDELLVELTPKEANDILVRASPKDVLQSMQSSLGVSGRKSSQSTGLTNSGVNGAGVQMYQIMTVYPPPPSKGGIAINTEDYVCLGEDQFLNDAIIDFYLRYLTLEVLSKADHNRTHVFSSYFYKRLTSPHAQVGETPQTLTAAARRHARVQKWTKNVNIFEKDFIIIPINEHAHWFLAIICFPGLVGKVIAAPQPPREKSAQKSSQKSKKAKDSKVQALTIGNTTITPVTTTITIDQMDEGSERDEAEGDDDEMEMDSDDEEETENQEENGAKSSSTSGTPVIPEVQKPMVKIPCILIFDSLAGASRSRVVATLRDYLSCEHVAKVGTEKVFSRDTIKGSSPKVPQQSNFTDCGLYLLQYVESFFQTPIRSYVLPIKSLKNWFEEIVVTRKREELAKLLVRLMNQTKGDKVINLPVVQFPTHDGKLRPKPETTPETKTSKNEADGKKKSAQAGAATTASQPTANIDDKTRLVAVSTSSVLTTANDNPGEKPELVTRTTTVYQIVPCTQSPLSTASGDSTPETLFDAKPKLSSATLSYLRNKRIPRLMTREQESHENQPSSAKKYKGDNEGATKSASSQIVSSPKPIVATNNDSCK